MSERGAVVAARDKELGLANENSKVKSALDKCTTNLMIADNNGQIVYINNSVTEMQGKAEAGIRKWLPQFNMRSLMGTNFDTLHQEPISSEELISQLICYLPHSNRSCIEDLSIDR